MATVGVVLNTGLPLSVLPWPPPLLTICRDRDVS